MDDAWLLDRLRRGRADALEQIMARYGGYVYTVVKNRCAGALPPEDLEEISSDVFLALWQMPERAPEGSLRAWLGAVARNKAVDRLRRHDPALPLEEDAVVLEDAAWNALRGADRTQLVREALSELDPLDREIFQRYYDLCESTAQIAEAISFTQAAVKTRLHRGRKQLKTYLQQRGFTHGDEI